MRKNVCLKATWRQPWRTMLLLLFCAGLTFAFLSQVLQYWVIQDAVADSAGYYHAALRDHRDPQTLAEERPVQGPAPSAATGIRAK